MAGGRTGAPAAARYLAAAAILWGGHAQAGPEAPGSGALDGWNFDLSPAALAALCDGVIAEAQSDFAAIENDSSPASLESVYGAYDAMNRKLQRIGHVWYLKSVHPDTRRQAAAETCVEQLTDFLVGVDLSQKFYHRVAAIDLSGARPGERLMVERRLRKFHRAGVDRDAQTRARVRELVHEITALGARFDRNIRADRRTVTATAGELDGLPADYVAAHPPDDRGVVRISTDYPDYHPVMKYAANDALRRRLFVAAKSIATPANEATLGALLRKRHELARLLDYDSHAAIAMDELMIGSPQRAREFLSSIAAAVREPAARDIEQMLARLRRIDPDASRVEAWQVPYLTTLLLQEEYSLDGREVRRYFPFDAVQRGLFRLTEELFGVQIVPWRTPVWHPEVTAWEMREKGAPIGRFYLDLHPRRDKYRHAAHWALRTGVAGGPLPVSGLATNFPRGLMEHGEVETFLHEFGHLLHNMFSGTQRWLAIGGMSMEEDFVEAPSQMLGEWVWDYDTLRTFARSDQGESIPASLVQRMNRARHLGEAAQTAAQLFYANLSLEYHDRPPESFRLLPLMRELQAEYSPYPYVPGTHFYNNFGHLNGYSSNYYMYQWSRAIALDLLSRFRAAGLHNRAVARDYRETILAPGGSRPAAELVEAFLGRPFSTGAYARYLDSLH